MKVLIILAAAFCLICCDTNEASSARVQVLTNAQTGNKIVREIVSNTTFGSDKQAYSIVSSDGLQSPAFLVAKADEGPFDVRWVDEYRILVRASDKRTIHFSNVASISGKVGSASGIYCEYSISLEVRDAFQAHK